MIPKTASSLIDFFLKRVGRMVTKDATQNDGNIHFLHIGKCAGTQIMHLARQINELTNKGKIVKHNHDFFLINLDIHQKYFFSIRNPISRFLSGFYSRKRKGQPRLYSEWSIYEERAFSNFEHANDLAESLFIDGIYGMKAFAAMKAIRHTAQNQSDWVYCVGEFLEIHPPIWIIRTECFLEDFSTFLQKIGYGIELHDLEIAKDPITSHANDYKGVPDLSEKAIKNLKEWYIQDFEFYKLCDYWIYNQKRFNSLCKNSQA